MKRTLLFIVTIVLLFVGCKKKEEVINYEVELGETAVEKGFDFVKINVEYSYPDKLKSVDMLLSENNDMDEARIYSCDVEQTSFSVTINNLNDDTKYYYQFEIDNGNEIIITEKDNFTTLKLFLPKVTTNAVSDITINSAICGGIVTDDGGDTITAKGICWSSMNIPDINDEHSDEGSGLGEFISTMSDLTSNTIYYVRAYATNKKGTGYGECMTFTTLEEIIIVPPTVMTLNVTNVTETTATCIGSVIDDGGTAIIEKGVCWSTMPNPTVDNAHINGGTEIGEFTINIDNLTPNTTYYVRAYAENSEGLSYGEDICFSTLEEIVLLPPTVMTNVVTNITHNSAIFNGDVVDDGGAIVTEKGFCWSVSPDPTIYDNHINVGADEGQFTIEIIGLNPETTYYVKAYAVNSVDVSYGESLSFTTLEEECFINGYEYVDLGLPSGLKWATCNVGSTTPEGYGDFFAWGEINTKDSYTPQNSITNGYQIGDISGNEQYDAARANWGATWRLPTKEELQELLDNCVFEKNIQNGVNGYKVTGRNGKYIFIPRAGFYSSDDHYYEGELGCYWSSTPYELLHSSYYLEFNAEEYVIEVGLRCNGACVRAVSN